MYPIHKISRQCTLFKEGEFSTLLTVDIKSISSLSFVSDLSSLLAISEGIGQGQLKLLFR